ncbi:MAG: Co2+/Mg2+ efflux protein ApaG [Bacteroidetes bacterium]|nr:MAG: Co2+/Mg2+ efflux protein ApaG [Bacteroidota bacterium]
MIPYIAMTEGIEVTVRPVYLDDRSDLLNRRFVFGYFVRIENQGDQEVQLLRCHWLIRDATGRVQEVQGDGVVGVQPVIAPGGVHEYSSYCILTTFEGNMEGNYLMQRPNGSRFRATIPRFNLRAASN